MREIKAGKGRPRPVKVPEAIEARQRTGQSGRGAMKRSTVRVEGCTLRGRWDTEAQVWYVAQSDVPGLATEAPALTGPTAITGMRTAALTARASGP